tara:strand:- start:276 stop:977 length:702 start_codon:yes stop_codon:yes gene_type:complete
MTQMNYLYIPLFHSPVIQTYLDENTDELKDIKDFSASHESTNVQQDYDLRDNDLNITPDGGGKRILEKYPRIRDILLDKFDFVCQNHLGFKKKKYIITTSWITFTPEGGLSQTHNHRNSFWSGVYYFQDEYPEGSSSIQFSNPVTPLSDYCYSSYDIEKFNHYNCESWGFLPEPKQLLLFPSYLMHRIMKNKCDKLRHSLAFNIVPVGRWGECDSSYDQEWTTLPYLESKFHK